jgi:hypothetical protein
MNASDIVKQKQNKVLYKAYYRPTVFQSTVFSTVNTVSSIINYVSSGVPLTSTSYTSCLNTVYNYMCEPTFQSYETRQAVGAGANDCMGKNPSKMQWKKTSLIPIYAYSTLYSSLVTPSTIAPSTVRVSSTLIPAGPMPFICPITQLQQGTSFAMSCPSCSHVLGSPGACCEQCS